ncbi:MAG: hypothetical protein HFJ32_03815, partial [Clostridia bacterium]|nr:hypothetical protein [Clostridia bacterium]
YMNEVDNMVDKYMNGTGNGGGPDTPTEPEEVPVENIKSDWATIEKIAEEIAKDDTITSDTEKVTVTVDNKKYIISAGDLFEVEYEGEVRRVRILGFKHDDLVDQTVYGGTHEKASISFEFLDFMTGDTYMSMNSTNTNANGWANTQMRKDLNGYTTNAAAQSGAIGGLGANLNNKSYIKQVKKTYIPTYNNTSTSTCNDYLWLLSCSEVWSKGRSDNSEAAYGLAIGKEGNQYKWYKDNEKGIDPSAANSNFVKKTSLLGSAIYWWLRSPSYDSSDGFCGVTPTGYADWSGANYGEGVAPGFSI